MCIKTMKAGVSMIYLKVLATPFASLLYCWGLFQMFQFCFPFADKAWMLGMSLALTILTCFLLTAGGFYKELENS